MSYRVTDFCDDPNNARTYLVINNDSCVIVDPANNLETLKKYVGEKHVEAILLTHGHYDHFKELENVLKEYDTTVYLHEAAFKKLTSPLKSGALFLFGKNYKLDLTNYKHVFVEHNQVIELPNFTIKCLYTPGHTNCSMSYIIGGFLFSGDLLFERTIGRSDLPTGNMVALNESLRTILNQNTNFLVLSGHDESFYLDDAKKYNDYLKKVIK